MKATITLEKKKASHFKTRDLFEPLQWAAILTAKAQSALENDGWVVEKVNVEP